MNARKTIAVLHERISWDAPPDQHDVETVAHAVAGALESLGYLPVIVQASMALDRLSDILTALRPACVFNLVESLAGHNSLIDVVPSLLEALGIPFTGAGSFSMNCTTSKPRTKQILELSSIPTPRWWSIEETINAGDKAHFPLIIKPISEDGSVGIDDSSVVRNNHQLRAKISSLGSEVHAFFAEKYRDGREFNVGLLETPDGDVEVLPIAEILFDHFPTSKPHIVSYAAKWHDDSFEYSHTERSFAFARQDKKLLNTIGELACRCRRVFGLKGYARVDFRIDADGNPWVLEVNPNPCISHEAGMTAAAQQAGYSYEELIDRILQSAMPPLSRPEPIKESEPQNSGKNKIKVYIPA